MAPRLLYVVAEDWYFLSHRLPMARAAKAAGFEVHVAARLSDGGTAIAAHGFWPHALRLRRGSLSPFGLLATAFQLRGLFGSIRPALVHNIAMKPILAGGIAALLSPRLLVVNSLTGRGAIFVDGSGGGHRLRAIVARLLRHLLKRRRSWTVVQNQDDAEFLRGLGAPAERMVLISGSGVDIDQLVPLPEPPPPVTAAYAGRMLTIKGVPTLIEAYTRLRQRGVSLRLILAGKCDPENPGSLAPEQLKEFAGAFGIQWLGHVEDVREVWKQSHFAVLASRGGEGLPKTLLEAAACGRAMIATDVPGSRDIAIDGETALVVPVDDVAALADAMQLLAEDAALRQRLGANARARVEKTFSADVIGKATVALYRRVLQTA